MNSERILRVIFFIEFFLLMAVRGYYGWKIRRAGGSSLQLREEHALVTSGPYRWVTHPMYTALFAFFVGLLPISATWLIAPLVVASIFMLYRRLDKEEAMMIEQFGDAYRAYMRRTGRLLPRFIHGSD
ncbi:MAG: isoprenylcysteine carboxylmethyltransferase family protein [Anaerolineae bacterium]